MVNVPINDSEKGKIFAPYNGQGGFQSLLKRLRGSYNPKLNALQLDAAQVEKVKRYYSKYGNGGFQDRLEIIVDKL